MNPIIYYLLQVIAASALLYGYYHIALRNKRFHRYNRFYLLSAMVISLLLPFLNIPVYFTQADTDSSIFLRTLTYISSPVPVYGTNPVQTASSNGIQATDIFYAIYITILLVACIRILLSCIKIRSLALNNPAERIDNITFFNTSEPGTPFSFFRWMFWNRAIELRSPRGEQIFKHELFHIRQKHSWDIVFSEMMTAVFWINPFFHLLKKELKTIHEFLADEFAISEEGNLQYAELLLMQTLNTRNQLINPFFHNQVKRRIAMIIHPKKTSQRYLRKLLVLPVAAIVILLFAFSYKKKDAQPVSANKEPGFRISGELNMTTDTVPKLVLREDKTNKSPDTIVWQKSGTKDGYVILEQKTVPDIKPWDTVHDKPLVVIDGKSIGNLNFAGIDMQLSLLNVKQVNVLKGPSAIKKYGQEGKNGVIEIISKNSTIKGNVQLKEITIEDQKQVKEVTLYDQKQVKEVTLQDPNSMIFEKVEIPPSFPGGEEKWKAYLEKNCNAMIPVDKGAPQGNYTVFIQFIVDKDGIIHDIKPLTKHGYGMEEEAIRIIKKGPNWEPAKQNGHIVKAYAKQRVDFVISLE